MEIYKTTGNPIYFTREIIEDGEGEVTGANYIRARHQEIICELNTEHDDGTKIYTDNNC